MTCIAVHCPHCHSEQIVKRGTTGCGTPRSLCQHTLCAPGSVLLDERDRGRLPAVQPPSIALSLKASGVRETARVLRISPDTVLRARRRQAAQLALVHTALLRRVPPDAMLGASERAGEAEREAMGSFVGTQSPPRWWWHAMEQPTGAV